MQDIIPPSNWNHVFSVKNPADLASRGITGPELKQSSLWWHGPEWFKLEKFSWPRKNNNINVNPIPEISKPSTQAMFSQQQKINIDQKVNELFKLF